MKKIVIIALFLSLLVSCNKNSNPAQPQDPTATFTITPTSSITQTHTLSPTVSMTPTCSATLTDTMTSTLTYTSTDTATITPTFTATPTVTSTATRTVTETPYCVSPSVIGDSSVPGANEQAWLNYYAVFTRIYVPSSVRATGIRLYTAASGDVFVGLYTDSPTSSGGTPRPDTLLSMSTQNSVAAGWSTIQITDQQLSPGYYQLGVSASNQFMGIYTNGGQSASMYKLFGPLPATVGNSDTVGYDKVMPVLLEYCP